MPFPITVFLLFSAPLRLCARQKPFLSPVRYLRVPRVPESPLLRIPASLREAKALSLARSLSPRPRVPESPLLRIPASLREYGFEDAVLFRLPVPKADRSGSSNVRVGFNNYSEAERVYAAASRGRLPTPNSEEPL